MKEIKEIDFYCRKCKKGLKISYYPTGDKSTPVMNGIVIRCHTNKCVRAMVMKNYTEGQLCDIADKNGKVFI